MEKINVLDLEGKTKEKIDLPEVFSTEYRSDLIRRAVLAAQANRRQRYGNERRAGEKTSAHYHGLTHLDPDQKMMGREMARLPREHGDTARFMRARLVANVVGGRRAHPPKVERIWNKKINRKERLLAIKSAIAATGNKEAVSERSHVFDFNLPLVVVDDIESIGKIKELKEFMKKIGMEKELERVSKRKLRSGKGKLRRGKHKNKIGPLIIVKKDRGLGKASRNVPGLDMVTLNRLNAETLSPGAHGIRLAVWSKSAIEGLSKV